MSLFATPVIIAELPDAMKPAPWPDVAAIAERLQTEAPAPYPPNMGRKSCRDLSAILDRLGPIEARPSPLNRNAIDLWFRGPTGAFDVLPDKHILDILNILRGVAAEYVPLMAIENRFLSGFRMEPMNASSIAYIESMIAEFGAQLRAHGAPEPVDLAKSRLGLKPLFRMRVVVVVK